MMKLSVWVAVSDLIPLRQTFKEKVIAFFDKKSTMFADLSCEEIFLALREVGVDGIELLLPFYTSGADIREVKRLFDTYKVPVLSIHQPLSGLVTSSVIERLCQAARLFSADVVVLHSGSLGKRLLDDSFIITLKSFQKKYKVKFGIENMENSSFASETFTFRAESFASVIDKAGLAMTFDVTHLAQVGEDVLDFFLNNKDKIVNIHMSDYRKLPVDFPIVSRFTTHLPLGDGSLPVEQLLLLLKKNHYGGLITMEINASLAGLCDSAKRIQNAMI